MREAIESLFRASEAGNLLKVRAILAEGRHDVDGGNYWQADIDPSGWERRPLHIAIIFGHLPLARWLLENGADPNVRTKYGDTPLSLVFESPLQPRWQDAATLLLDAGADPAIVNDEGESPLARAQGIPIVWSVLQARLSRID